jgi:hypothetical protein
VPTATKKLNQEKQNLLKSFSFAKPVTTESKQKEEDIMLETRKIFTKELHQEYKICSRCKGTGNIKNKHGKKKKCTKLKKQFMQMWPTIENVDKMIKISKQVDWWEPMVLCPECGGRGIR